MLIGIVAVVLVLAIPLSEKYSVAACSPAFASVVFWWIATGLDGWADKGGGVGNSVEALGAPATAGAGAFGGVISTPHFFVFVNVLITLFVGLACGMASGRLSALITPKKDGANA